MFSLNSRKLFDVDMSDAICDALEQFGCYHHRYMCVYVCRVLAIPPRAFVTGNCSQSTVLPAQCLCECLKHRAEVFLLSYFCMFLI